MDPFLLFSSALDDAASPLVIGADEFVRLPALQGLSDGCAVAVALSGGPDSMALCALAQEWALPRSLKIHAITIDHALRPESAAEAQRVGEWVNRHIPGVTHAIIRRDPSLITATKLQERARHDRYRLMADYCHAHGIGHLLLAHHQDDQAETFLFRLCKGSGLDGLVSMREESPLGDIQLVRPLLSLSKERLLATCQARSLPYVNDPSNRNDNFARVRLRKLAAALSDEGLSSKRLAVTAQRLARARDALDYFTAQTWARAQRVSGDSTLVFDLEMLRAEPEDIRVRILMRALDEIGGDSDYGPRLERVEELSRAIFTESGFARTTLHHCMIQTSAARGTLSFRREIA